MGLLLLERDLFQELFYIPAQDVANNKAKCGSYLWLALIQKMIQKEPRDRPDTSEVLSEFKKCSEIKLLGRRELGISKKTETALHLAPSGERPEFDQSIKAILKMIFKSIDRLLETAVRMWLISDEIKNKIKTEIDERFREEMEIQLRRIMHPKLAKMDGVVQRVR